MKIELASNVAGGAGSAAIMLAQSGASPLSVALAALGAVIAVIELEERTLSKMAVLLIFSLVVGSLGAPLVVGAFDAVPESALFIVSFLLDYVSHDVFSHLRSPMTAALVAFSQRMIGGKK